LAIGAFSTVTVGSNGESHKQPYFDSINNVLYYVAGNGIVSAALTGATPSILSSWGAETAVLSPEPWGSMPPARANSIGSIGQPSLATIASTGKRELYFVYVVWTGTGTNFHVGVVPHI
jgi:hypothetical protein